MQKWTLESSLHAAKGMLPPPSPMCPGLHSIPRVPSGNSVEAAAWTSKMFIERQGHTFPSADILVWTVPSLTPDVSLHPLCIWRNQTNEKWILKITSKRRSGYSQPNTPLSQFSSCTNSSTDTAERVERRQEQVATACLSRYYLWKMHMKSCLISSDQ